MQDVSPGVGVVTDEVVARFGVHLDVARGLSPHTVRAYLGDVRHLLGYAARHGSSWDRVDLGLLRSWLAAMVAARLSRSTIARRGAAVRAFYSWALAEGLVAEDPAVRLVTAQPRPALPTTLAVAPTTHLIEVARDGGGRRRPDRTAGLGAGRAAVRHRCADR